MNIDVITAAISDMSHVFSMDNVRGWTNDGPLDDAGKM